MQLGTNMKCGVGKIWTFIPEMRSSLGLKNIGFRFLAWIGVELLKFERGIMSVWSLEQEAMI